MSSDPSGDPASASPPVPVPAKKKPKPLGVRGWYQSHYYRRDGRSLCRTQRLPENTKAEQLHDVEPRGGDCLRCTIEYAVQFNPNHSVSKPYLIYALDVAAGALRPFAAQPGVAEKLALMDEVLRMAGPLKGGAA
jgi:hypothetical protein